MISKITDKVMDTANAWRNRTLDKVYPIVYMDAGILKLEKIIESLLKLPIYV